MCRKNRGNRHCFVYRSPEVAKYRPPQTCRPAQPISSDYAEEHPVVQQHRRTLPRYYSNAEDVQRRPPMELSETSLDCYCTPPQPPIQRRTPCRCPLVAAPRVQQPKRPCCNSITQLAPKVAKPHPTHYLPPASHVNNFPPAIRAMSEPMQDANDQYHSYNRNLQNNGGVGINPLANFDLNRFDQDRTFNERRRNVSIRTMVDYDYDPGNNQPPIQIQNSPMPSHAYPPRRNFRQSSPESYPEYESRLHNSRFLPHVEQSTQSYPEHVAARQGNYEDDQDALSNMSSCVPCRYRR